MAQRALDLYKNLKAIQRNLKYGNMDSEVEALPGDKDGVKRARMLAKRQKEKLAEETLRLGNHIRDMAEAEN